MTHVGSLYITDILQLDLIAQATAVLRNVFLTIKLLVLMF